MFCAILLQTADSTLGRVDCNSLSDQTLMELLYEGFDEETQQRYQDENGVYLDVCNWSCTACGADDRVVEIVEYSRISGSLEIRYIPPKVKLRILSCQQLSYLKTDQLTGSIDLTNLPNKMQYLHLQHNLFTGSIDLTKLPEDILELTLNNNRLSGSLCFAELPAKIRCINVQHNFFTGSFVATNLQPSLREICARENQFEAIAVVDSQTKAFIDLIESGVRAVVDENGNEKVGRVRF